MNMYRETKLLLYPWIVAKMIVVMTTIEAMTRKRNMKKIHKNTVD